MKHNRKGFSVVEAFIILVIIGLVGAAGWYVYNRSKKSDNQSSSSTASTTEDNLETAASRPEDGVTWSTQAQGPYHDSVSYATSSDLLNWTDSGTTIAEHASVPDVINKDGTLYMYFVDTTTDGLPEQLALMKSTDNGKTWSDRQRVSIKGKGIAGEIPVDPSPFLMNDGSIRLYYFDISGSRNPNSTSPNRIYSAVSSDGINFTQEDGVRFEEENIYDPSVIQVGDTWRLYVGKPDNQQVVSATSTDGLNFTREGVAYDGSSVPDAIYENGKYYLYTAGIQIATSSDGASYAKTSSRFMSSSGLTADPGVIKLGDNSYLMVYKTSDQTPSMPPM